MRAFSPVAVGTLTELAQSGAESAPTIVPFNTENIGGGTWNYGSVPQLDGSRKCYSHYVHPTKTHTATAIISDQNVKVQRNAGIWANADAIGGVFNKCKAYWNVI